MRLAAAAVVVIALQGAGCLPAGFRVGQPPIDDGWYTLRNRLMDAVPRHVNTAVIAAAPPGTTVVELGWMSSGSSGEHEWSRHVRYAHPDGRTEPLPPGWTRQVRNAIEHAMLTELGGVEVHPSLPTEPVAEHRFLIRYTRANGGVGGDLVGRIEPSERYAGYTKITVVQTEWCTK